jgi:hypothetical protein
MEGGGRFQSAMAKPRLTGPRIASHNQVNPAARRDRQHPRIPVSGVEVGRTVAFSAHLGRVGDRVVASPVACWSGEQQASKSLRAGDGWCVSVVNETSSRLGMGASVSSVAARGRDHVRPVSELVTAVTTCFSIPPNWFEASVSSSRRYPPPARGNRSGRLLRRARRIPRSWRLGPVNAVLGWFRPSTAIRTKTRLHSRALPEPLCLPRKL